MAKLGYVEPADYFPKEIRKKAGLGEFNEDVKKIEQERAKKKENQGFRDFVNKKGD